MFIEENSVLQLLHYLLGLSRAKWLSKYSKQSIPSFLDSEESTFLLSIKYSGVICFSTSEIPYWKLIEKDSSILLKAYRCLVENYKINNSICLLINRKYKVDL